jgi:hypothetical protein
MQAAGDESGTGESVPVGINIGASQQGCFNGYQDAVASRSLAGRRLSLAAATSERARVPQPALEVVRFFDAIFVQFQFQVAMGAKAAPQGIVTGATEVGRVPGNGIWQERVRGAPLFQEGAVADASTGKTILRALIDGTAVLMSPVPGKDLFLNLPAQLGHLLKEGGGGGGPQEETI